MNAAVVAVLGGVMIYLAYNLYARRIDRDVLRPDPKKATPARMYMDGVDFMPTSRSVLYGYHFKSIAAAGPDRKSTRLNSSHGYISYAVFCLKKKKKNNTYHRT